MCNLGFKLVALCAAAVLAACATAPLPFGRATQPGLSAPAAAARVNELLATPLTQASAVEIALLNNPGLDAEFATLGLSVAAVYDAARIGNPSLGAARLTGAGADSRLELSLSLGFGDLLWLGTRKRLARAELASAENRLRAAMETLRRSTELAWVNAVAAEQLVTQRQLIEAAASAGAQSAQQYVDAGNMSTLDLARQQLVESAARLEVQRAQIDSAAARAQLYLLLGIGEPQTELSLPALLPEAPADNYSLEALLRSAREQRRDLEAARIESQARAEYSQAVRRRAWLGESSVGAEGEREGSADWQRGPALELQLPIFNRGRGVVTRAAAEAERTAAEHRRLDGQVATEVRRDWLTLQAVRLQLATHRESVLPLLRAIEVETAQRASFMLVGQFELLEARIANWQAQQAASEALRDYWRARLALSASIGGELPTVGAELEVAP